MVVDMKFFLMIFLVLMMFLINACGKKGEALGGYVVTFDEDGCHSSDFITKGKNPCEVFYEGDVIYSNIDINVTYNPGAIEITQDVYRNGTVRVK